MLQTSQSILETPSKGQKSSPHVNVLMPNGMFGFQTINHYAMSPLFPDNESWIYWKLTARDFLAEECAGVAYVTHLCSKPDTLSFILLALETLEVGGITIQKQDIEFCLKSLGIQYEECIVFLVISIETDDKGVVANMTANVKAPLIFHSITKQAWQVILPEGTCSTYPISLPLIGC